MISANTNLTHWTYMYDPKHAFLPDDTIYTVAPYRQGLWLTVRRTKEGYDLIGRVITSANSKFAASLAKALEQRYGGKISTLTTVVRHKVLPETQGRNSLHAAINNESDQLSWDAYDFDIYEAVGEGIDNWPVMTFAAVANTYEMNDFHLQVNQSDPHATGILLCEEKDGVQRWFRRPFQYQMVGTFTRIDQSGKLFIEWVDDNGNTYSGFFLRGVKAVVEDLIKKHGKDIIGKKALITFQAKAEIKPHYWRLYNVRFERLCEEGELITDQLALTFY